MDQTEQNLAEQNEQEEEENLGQEAEEEPSQEEEEEQEQEQEQEEESESEAESEQEEEGEAPRSDEQQPSTQIDDPAVPAPPPFDPSRMIGIIRRKSLIKELAAMYHAECLSYCQELLELQRKGEEPLVDLKHPEDLKKDAIRPPKRLKKTVRR